MAKKSSRRPSSPERIRLEEFAAEHEESGPAPGRFIEYDPQLAESLESAQAFAAESADMLSTILPDSDLLAARDEIIQMLSLPEVSTEATAFAASPEILGSENFMGFGVGPKSVAGSYTNDMAVKVYVREKVSSRKLEGSHFIPPEIDGLPTDVEEVGEIRPFSYARRYQRPAPCGVSCGHPSITAGTIGCLVALHNNRLCILSNNHVLANENRAQTGDPIIHPGRLDGGSGAGDRIAALENFVPLQFPGPNLVDAAVAWTSASRVKSEHVTYKLNPQPVRPSMYLGVMKNGRTTQATVGMITGMSVNRLRVSFSRGMAHFNDQLVIQSVGLKPFSQGGDSGSLIVTTGSKQPVGLLFAGSGTHTFANPILTVMTQLGIREFVAD